MFKKTVMLAFLALPLAAFASSIDVANSGRTISGNSSGLSLTGSVLINAILLHDQVAPLLGRRATTQLTINTGTSLFSGSADLSSGDATLKVAIPEPGTLVLFGTGLMGLAGILRKRAMRR